MVYRFELLNTVNMPNNWGELFYSSIKRERLRRGLPQDFEQIATIVGPEDGLASRRPERIGLPDLL